MFSYCVHELRLSEDCAYKRIQAARVARQFPAIFAALGDGRLHLSAVVLLAPYLTLENADGLLAAAAHNSKSEIEELLARRFPRSETMGLVQALPASAPQIDQPLAPGRVEAPGPMCLGAPASQLAPGQVGPRSKLAPVAPDRYLLQVTIGRSTQEKLRYAQDLLGHAVPSGDLAQVLDRALEALIKQLERHKFGATTKPRQETSARAADQARRQAAAARAAAEEVMAPLRQLGFRPEEARRAAALCASIPEASLEQRVRRALSYLHPRPRTVAGAATSLGSAP